MTESTLPLLNADELRILGSLIEKEMTTPDYYPLTLNALVASDTALIPIQCEYYALEGVGNLMSTIRRIQSGFNRLLKIEGFLLTMFDARNNLSRQVVDDVPLVVGPHGRAQPGDQR